MNRNNELSDHTLKDNNNDFVFLDCSGKADIAFVLDSSGSIRSANPRDRSFDNWDLMLQFVIQLISRLSISRNNIRVASLRYSHEARLDFHLNRYFTLSELTQAIRRLEYIDNNTNTADALWMMRTVIFDPTKSGARGDRPDVPNIAILITDGVSNVNERNTIPFADQAKRDGIRILVIGVTDKIDERELIAISSNGVLNQTYWKSLDFQALDSIVASIINQTCKFVIPGKILKYNL